MLMLCSDGADWSGSNAVASWADGLLRRESDGLPGLKTRESLSIGNLHNSYQTSCAWISVDIKLLIIFSIHIKADPYFFTIRSH